MTGTRGSASPARSGVLALLALLLPAAHGEVATVSPDSPILGNIGVPFLHESVPEHRLSGDGLVLVPVGDPYDWIKTGPTTEPFRLRVSVGGGRFDHGLLTVWNWRNHAVKQWKVGADREEILEIRIEGLGSYLLTFDGWRDGGVGARLIRNLAVTRDLNPARSTWRTDEFFAGICAFPGRYHWTPGGSPALPSGLTEEQARDREAGLIARLGLQVVRTDESLEMGRREDEAGHEEYHFDFSRMDAAVAAYTERGFQLALQTMNAADWAVLPRYADQGKNRWRYPHRERPQRAYLSALVKRYAPHTRFVQISNEPDQTGYWSGTTGEFVDQFRFSIDEIRKAAPDLPVTNGGYSLVDEEKCAQVLESIRGLVDFPSYNAHGNLEDYRRSFATMRRLQAKAGDAAARWVNTEAGYSAWRLDQERRQAQVDVQKVLYSWANGHAGILLFCARMTRGPGRDGDPDFGLLDYQYCPRFAYASVAALAGTLTNTSFRATLVEEGGCHLYCFEGDDGLVLAGFSLEETPGTDSVEVETDAASVVAVDEMGNERAVEASTRLSLSLDAYPRYWILREATRAEAR